MKKLIYRATCYMIQLYDILKEANYGSVKKSVLFRGGWERRMNGTQIFGAVKIFCVVLYRWVYIILYLSKPIECTVQD